MSKKIRIVISTLIITTIINGQLVLADVTNNTNQSMQQPPIMQNNQNNHSHGSDTIVSEPNNTIEEGYQINKDTQAKAKDGKYEKLFNTDEIETVNIEISDNNWNYLLQNAIDEPSVLANSFSIGDEKIENVGIKTKGNLTLSSVWNSNSDRFSFTINTKKYIKKSIYGENQNFYGINKIALNNIYGDASYLKEYLSYKLMQDMGIPSPKCSIVKLCVNGEYYGVYTMVESMDESLIKRTQDSSNGALYKCESPGGDLLYNDTLDSLYDTQNNKFNFDIDTYNDVSNPLSKYTGILENQCYGATVDEHDDDEKEEVQNNVNDLFVWMKELNKLNESNDCNTDEYKAKVENIMNVDEILKYFAVNTYLVNLDSYQSEKMQNYALYLYNGKATVLPWDYNYSLGGYGVLNSNSMVNFSISNPVINTTLAERPLLNVLLKNDDYKKQYNEYLSNCLQIVSLGGEVNGIQYDKGNYSKEISKYSEMLDELVKDDPTAFYNYDKFKSACTNLSSLIDLRSEAVSKQLSGDSSEVDASSVNLNEIGDAVGGGPNNGGPGNPPNGMKPPEGMGTGTPGGMPPQGGGNPPNGMMPPEGMGTGTPGGMPPQGGGNPPNGMMPPEGTGTPGEMPPQDGGNPPNEMGTGTPDEQGGENQSNGTSTPDDKDNSNTGSSKNAISVLGVMSASILALVKSKKKFARK